MSQVLLKANDPCWCGSGRKYKRCHRATEGRVLPGRVSPMREVPADIARPDYAETGQPGPRAEPMVKTARCHRPHAAWRAGWRPRCWPRPAPRWRPGVTTDELDADLPRGLHRPGRLPEPAQLPRLPQVASAPRSTRSSATASPTTGRCDDGDIVNLDVTVFLDGVHGDTNATFLVGEVDDDVPPLVAGHRRVPGLGHRRRAARPAHAPTSAGPSRPTPRPTASAWCGPSSATGSASSSTPPPSVPHYYTTSATHRDGARDDLHHRAHDHAGHAGASRCGTTAGRR